jgi:hypothetical protein
MAHKLALYLCFGNKLSMSMTERTEAEERRGRGGENRKRQRNRKRLEEARVEQTMPYLS